MFWLLVGELALILWDILNHLKWFHNFCCFLSLRLTTHTCHITVVLLKLEYIKCRILCTCLFVMPLYLILWRDQFLFSWDAAEELRQAIAKKNHELVFLYDINLVDEIWKESRPTPPNQPIRVHNLKYAGLDVASKLSSLRSELVEAGSSAIVITMLDEIAWLLNLVIHLTTSLGPFSGFNLLLCDSRDEVIIIIKWSFYSSVLLS